MSKADQVLRDQLTHLLRGDQAHMSFADAVKDFPMKDINVKPPNVDYTFWHLLEHLRLTQADILEFILEKNYREKKWPEDYWPAKSATAKPEDWQQTMKQFNHDLNRLIDIVGDKSITLTDPIPYAPEPHFTYVREIIVVANHNSYHIGELGILRQVVGNWT
jgi:hypothetical protein